MIFGYLGIYTASVCFLARCRMVTNQVILLFACIRSSNENLIMNVLAANPPAR